MSKLLLQLYINLLLIFMMIIYIQTLKVPIKIKSSENNTTKTDPIELDPTELSTVAMIEKNGYTAEIHKVTTNDGYILELHRIPKSHDGTPSTRNYPVVIPHCLLGSSADWVIAGRERSLPMQLADDGFDVWLVNYRGNTYSRKHKILTDEEFDFWNFSLHELGVKDLPAVIDHVLKETKTDQLHYIGFSMGSTTFFILASEIKDYQKKIRSNISLAPVTNIYHSKSSLKTLGPWPRKLNSFVNVVSHGRFLPHHRKILKFVKKVCKSDWMLKRVCLKWLIFYSCGDDPESFDEKLLPLILGHIPAGTSSKLIVHFSQFITTESFGQYDYGRKWNLKMYNLETPPAYNLNSIHVPMYFFQGENDLLATPKDVEILRNKLPNVIDVITVENKLFNHLDFVFSKSVNKEINDPVKKILQKTDAKNWKAENEQMKKSRKIKETKQAVKWID